MRLAATSPTMSIQDLTADRQRRHRHPPRGRRWRRRRPGLRRPQPAGPDHHRSQRARRPRPHDRRPQFGARQRRRSTRRPARFRTPTARLLVRADASAKSADEIGNIQINPQTRVGDVADVVFGPADKTTSLRINGQTGVGLGIVRQARANTLDISAGVRAAIAELKNSLPAGVNLTITSDDADYIGSAIHEVLLTLLIATAIVIAIIYLFLRSRPRHLHPGGDRADRADRHAGGDVGGRLLDQHPDAAGAGAGDRSGRRRRHRRHREHLAPARARPRPARRRRARHPAGVLRRSRDHRDAGRRVHSDLVLPRPRPARFSPSSASCSPLP